jgi:site-specific DNA-methyltransferase (adenine-specific)
LLNRCVTWPFPLTSCGRWTGSGSTLIAAHSTGRRAVLMELDPGYVDVICRRYQEHTGTKPILEATGEPHDFTA